MAVQIARPNDMMMRDPLKGPIYRPNPTQQQRPEPSAAEQFGQMAQNRAMEKGLQTGEEKIMEGASSFMTPSVAAPSATQMNAMSSMAGQGLSPGAAQAVMGSGSSAAPLVAQAAGQTAGQLAATTGSQLATGAATNAAAAGAGTGAMATMGAAVPYVGAALLADEVLGLGLRENVLGFDKGGQVEPTYANMGKMIMSGGLGPLAIKKMKEEGMPMGMGLASMLSEGGEVRGVEQQLETGKRQDMSKGPLGLLDMFVKGIDALTGYDRANEKRADLPEGKRDMLINKRKNPYTGEYPITEEEYQQVMDREPVNLGHGGIAGPLSKVEYKSAGGETYKLSYGGPISKGA